ncbi:MAG: hypothetical protein QHG99_05550 [Methanomicrobiales archaeon]|nr:hypothetical protein [Methanomicrobiales archaeon]
MRYYLLVLAVVVLVTVAGAVSHTFTFHFGARCPPDDCVILKCFDLRGELAISIPMKIGERRAFEVDERFRNLVCVVICNGTVVYKKRFDLPGAAWKAVADYPWDI